MKLSKYIVLGAIALSSPAFVACVGDLDVTPENPTTKTEISTAEELYGELAGIYGGLVFEGGITVDDGGAGVYTRQLWNLQELCSDETLIGSNWADGGINELVYSTWSPDNHWLYECFSRFNYQIAIVNQFLRDLHKYGSLLPGSDNLSVEVFDAEARTLRALSYYHMIDIFGVGPWTTEDSPVGVTPPTYDRKQLFEAVVEDLANAIPNLVPASQQVYGRLSREAGYMLLAKLYLNAEVYTGEPRWQDCANACNEIRKTISSVPPTTSMWATVKSSGVFLRTELPSPHTAVLPISRAAATVATQNSSRPSDSQCRDGKVPASAKNFQKRFFPTMHDVLSTKENTPRTYRTSATRIRATCA